MKKLFLILVIAAGAVVYLNQSRPLWYVALLNYLNLGGATISINFDSLKSDVTEASIKDSFSHLKFTCNPERSRLGDRSCWETINKFNGIVPYKPARVTFPVPNRVILYVTKNHVIIGQCSYRGGIYIFQREGKSLG